MERTESAAKIDAGRIDAGKIEAVDCEERSASPIRTILMLGFWAAALPIAALTGFPWTYLTKDITFLYKSCMWAAFTGVRLAGVRVQAIGLEKIDPARTYIFMSNHISNLDPPITLPLIPRRTSVMVKKELFKVPILKQIMLIGSLVPVDRGNRDSGIAAVRDAVKAIRGERLNMTIYVEGKRSFDGKLLPFKKGPFYLAKECQVPIVPITISGTEHLMPKARFGIRPGVATVHFHDAIEPENFGSREDLMAKVRSAINSGLPKEMQE
ncbi:MAG: lysophospholipid acyltransferase family protein [Terriglobales bacterium]|jgi:1-acyl-sn-glycerol-3-phosphate acyltransferase